MIHKRIVDLVSSSTGSLLYMMNSDSLFGFITNKETKQELLNASIALVVAVVATIIKDVTSKLIKYVRNKRRIRRNKRK